MSGSPERKVVTNLTEAIRVVARLEMDRIYSGNKWCRHYSGLMKEECSAGVRYADVKGPGKPMNYPCFKDRCEGTSCSSQSFYTDEEAWDRIEESRRSISEYFGKLAANVCPICDAPVERQRQVGPCVYAVPCGHRLFQGRAQRRKKEKVS